FLFFFFFFSSRRRHTRSKRDWSSDVCSSDLAQRPFITFNRSTRQTNIDLGSLHLCQPFIVNLLHGARSVFQVDIKPARGLGDFRSEEHTSELQSRFDLVCRLLLEKKKRELHG